MAKLIMEIQPTLQQKKTSHAFTVIRCAVIRPTANIFSCQHKAVMMRRLNTGYRKCRQLRVDKAQSTSGKTSGRKCLDTGLRTSENQRVNVVCTLVGIDRFEIQDMSNHMVFV